MYRTKVLMLSKYELPSVFLKTIKKVGLTVRAIRTYESAFELVHKKTYRLICIDTSGFGTDILETINRMSKIKQGIVMIGIIPRNQSIIYAKLINNGMFEVLQKPLKPNTVEASVKRAIHVLNLYRELSLFPDPKKIGYRGTDLQLTDREIENLGLDELINKKLSILFSKHTHKKITNLYQLVMPIVERSFIETALKLSNNNQLKASLVLGINRNTLKTKMTKFGIKNQ